MRKRQLMVGLLAAGMVMTTVSGCGSQGGDSKQTANEGKTTAQANTASSEKTVTADGISLPITDEPITLKVFAPADAENRREDNLQTKELEASTGIKIEWMTAANENIQEKLNVILASGDLPDIIFTGVGMANKYDKATEQSLGEQGLVIPLNEYLDTISVGYKKAFEKDENLRDYITTPSGDIYSLPNVDGNIHVQYNLKCWMNTEWLDRLGLEMPETTEEFYQVLKAFKEQDANGNGDPNDEIPLSTVTSGAGTQVDGFLMNPFQLTSDINGLYVDNGVVTYAPVQEGYKEGLLYLNKLYEEGLLNPESFTQDRVNQVNINEAGEECVIGCILASRPGYACDTSAAATSEKWKQYQPVPALTGPSGQCVSSWNPYCGYATGMTFITSSCKYPEEAFRLLDYLATEEMSYRSFLGVEGVHWQKLPEDTDKVGVDGSKAKWETIPTDDVNYCWGQLACLVRHEDWQLGQAMPADPYAEGVKPPQGTQVLFYKAAKDLDKTRQPLESVMPSLYMNSEDASQRSLLETTIIDTQKEAMVQFITGSRDIESEWEAYKASLESVGLSEYLQILQKAYDASAFASR